MPPIRRSGAEERPLVSASKKALAQAAFADTQRG